MTRKSVLSDNRPYGRRHMHFCVDGEFYLTVNHVWNAAKKRGFTGSCSWVGKRLREGCATWQAILSPRSPMMGECRSEVTRRGNATKQKNCEEMRKIIAELDARKALIAPTNLLVQQDDE